jgi:hypothetical protein
MVDGAQKSIYVGKFLGSRHGTRIYSLPGEDPVASINFETMLQYCRNKGTGHHLTTWAEYAFLALWCKKNGTQPRGNNNYGKDTAESNYVAIPTYYDGSKNIARVATGSGPVTWSHDGTEAGIWDLNGNVWEWAAGMRLVKGEVQFIPYNNAAKPDCDMGANSTEWKAINANATSYADLYITPDGSGTTEGSVKLDYVSSHWQLGTSITSQADSSRSCQFSSITSSGLSDFCKMFLRAMVLLPEDGDTDYGGDYFWANNASDERCPSRGGGWSAGGSAGVFYVRLHYPRSSVNDNLGGRPAYFE